MAGLILVICLLWLSDRRRWFGFNHHKGWTVLIAVGVVAVWAVVAGLGCIAGLIFRRRVQFSLRSLLLFVLAASVACGWFASEIRHARRQAAAIRAITSDGGSADYSWQASLVGPIGNLKYRPPIFIFDNWLPRVETPSAAVHGSTVWSRFFLDS